MLHFQVALYPVPLPDGDHQTLGESNRGIDDIADIFCSFRITICLDAGSFHIPDGLSHDNGSKSKTAIFSFYVKRIILQHVHQRAGIVCVAASGPFPAAVSLDVRNIHQAADKNGPCRGQQTRQRIFSHLPGGRLPQQMILHHTEQGNIVDGVNVAVAAHGFLIRHKSHCHVVFFPLNAEDITYAVDRRGGTGILPSANFSSSLFPLPSSILSLPSQNHRRARRRAASPSYCGETSPKARLRQRRGGGVVFVRVHGRGAQDFRRCFIERMTAVGGQSGQKAFCRRADRGELAQCPQTGFHLLHVRADVDIILHVPHIFDDGGRGPDSILAFGLLCNGRHLGDFYRLCHDRDTPGEAGRPGHFIKLGASGAVEKFPDNPRLHVIRLPSVNGFQEIFWIGPGKFLYPAKGQPWDVKAMLLALFFSAGVKTQIPPKRLGMNLVFLKKHPDDPR